MATSPQAMHNFNVQIAPDSSGSPGTWIDLDTYLSTFEPSGGARTTGSAYVVAQDSPVVTTGKREALTAKLKLLYTSGTTAAQQDYNKLRAYFDANTKVWIKYLPISTDTTTYYIAGPGYLTNVPAPPGDAASGDPFSVEVELILTADAMTIPAS